MAERRVTMPGLRERVGRWLLRNGERVVRKERMILADHVRRAALIDFSMGL